ncbi:HU family DNA-binding protein [Primorskyibacter sp. 2E233]|uniref:HU family DNA-binding protein n=1 Tax=Primorskyibacter sp. 2E233 TaxID=3413431 RepID=UPI003BEFB6D5
MVAETKTRKRRASAADTPEAAVGKPRKTRAKASPIVETPAHGAAPDVTASEKAVRQSDAPSVSETAQQPKVEMKKKELIDLVVERSGVKKRDAKPAIEAALVILGQALADGRPLNLQPLGKVKVSNTKQKDNALVLNARVRQSSKDEIS